MKTRLSHAMKCGGLVAAVMCLSGCAKNQEPLTHDEFAPNDSSRAVWQAVDKQAALGARQNAMLNADDFEAEQLNGLGKAHVDAMMAAKPGPAVIYVNLNAQDGSTNARRDAVAQYVSQLAGADSGAQPRIEIGANWSDSSLAADGITRLPKTENPSAHGSDSGSGSSSSTGGQNMTGGGSGGTSGGGYGGGSH